MTTQHHRPPRDPDLYEDSAHFERDALEDPRRFLTRADVPQVIADGRDYPKEGGPGKVRRKLDVDGVDMVLVIPDDEPLLVTGWTEVGDWARALSSDRWSLDQLRTIRDFEVKGRPAPDR